MAPTFASSGRLEESGAVWTSHKTGVSPDEALPQQEIYMDVFDVLDPQVAHRLRDSAVGSFAQAYWDRLCGQGYAASTVRVYLNCLSHFARWAARHRFELAELEDHVGRFVDQHLPRCRCAGRVQRVRHTVRAALEHLKTVVAAAGIRPKTAPLSPADEQLQRFDQ